MTVRYVQQPVETKKVEFPKIYWQVRGASEQWKAAKNAFTAVRRFSCENLLFVKYLANKKEHFLYPVVCA